MEMSLPKGAPGREGEGVEARSPRLHWVLVLFAQVPRLGADGAELGLLAP